MLQVHSKIKSAPEVLRLLGEPPRKRRVILCHGVFDVVHPGHVTHLLYAKSKADVLVASLTSDRYVSKSPDRPYVPQDLRAVNLASYEMVDYVVVDDNEEPLELLRTLRPEYFARGYEYSGGGPKTRTESSVVAEYGGEMLFTPGDVVYSSSRLIDLAPPDLKYAKLQMLMRREGVDLNRLREAIGEAGTFRVHVVGDTIVDSIVHSHVVGASSKTPTISVQVERTENFVGGAAVVAKHLRAAGAAVSFSTVLGNDALGQMVLDDLSALGIEVLHQVDVDRPTTNKVAVEAGGYRLLKMDTVDNRPVSDQILARLRADLVETVSEAVVFSDFRHGIFNRRSIAGLTSSIERGVFRVADSQVASRWGNILEFSGFDLVTPNEREGRFALGDQESGVRTLTDLLYSESRCRNLILKLGDAGVMAKNEAGSFVIDSLAPVVVDPVGAGDALLAYATLAMLARDDLVIAAILGTLAAGINCARDGNVQVAVGEVLAAVDDLERNLQL